MNELDEYILDSIRRWVWSGFYSRKQIDDMISDILEDGADEPFLRASVEPEFEKKAVAEESWPATTDCDRLDFAFAELNRRGIIALQNAGYTISDGHSDVAEELHKRGRAGVKGYCFYHGQDLERAIDGGGLMIAFGDLDDDKIQKTEVGKFVSDVLKWFEFDVEWNCDSETRISLPRINWQRRLAP